MSKLTDLAGWNADCVAVAAVADAGPIGPACLVRVLVADQ